MPLCSHLHMFPFSSSIVEWIDFPRGDQHLPNGAVIPGNNYSYDKCRRRFDLVSKKLSPVTFYLLCFSNYDSHDKMNCNNGQEH